MKALIRELLARALTAVKADSQLPLTIPDIIPLERARDRKHGDFATNIAMLLAKPCAMPPRQLAELIVQHFPKHEAVSQISIAGPGFINIELSFAAYRDLLKSIFTEGEAFGRNQSGADKRVHIEYVSANPTGPLHVGHGRGAAYGSSLANLLMANGFSVFQEYYVNDAGRQMDILAASVWLRYLEMFNPLPRFPDNAYRGDYVKDIAALVKQQHGEQFCCDTDALFQALPKDAEHGGDKEIYIDALVSSMRQQLGDEGFATIHAAGLHHILEDIKQDLTEFGVLHDSWFSEQSLLRDDLVEASLSALKQAGFTYEREGALWFNAVHFGDEKDRVLIRANGSYTYFASDIAYHFAKYQRGYDEVIDILGADHHGYVSRIKASIQALGHSAESLSVPMVQFAVLYRGTERVQMSTRSGSFVTLRELRQEVGNDASRFFYVMRKANQHLDFDLELAKSHSSDNPVYYIQYAHARICSVLRQAEEKGIMAAADPNAIDWALLTQPHEKELINTLSRYPELIEYAGSQKEPHLIAHYLRELANAFHTYYNAEQFLVADEALCTARLGLITATRQVIANALSLLAVSAPEVM